MAIMGAGRLDLIVRMARSPSPRYRHGRWRGQLRGQVVGNLDNQVKPALASRPDKVLDPRRSGALDGGLALADFLEQRLDKVVKEFLTIAEENMVRLHFALGVGQYRLALNVAILALERAAQLPLSKLRNAFAGPDNWPDSPGKTERNAAPPGCAA